MKETIRGVIERYGGPLLHSLGLGVTGRWIAPGDIVPAAAMSQGEAVNRFQWIKRELNFKPERIVDVGASDGRWTMPMRSIFPDAEILMIEPLDCYREKLSEMAAADEKIKYVRSLVGDKEGTVQFMCHEHQSSIYGNSKGEAFGEVVEAEMKTLDAIIAEADFLMPDLIKLDIQGAELKALKGASEALAHAEFVQLEVSFIPLQKDIPLFGQIAGFMHEKGFRVFDIYGVYGRPLDGMPAQGECLFIRQDSGLVTDYRWDKDTDWS